MRKVSGYTVYIAFGIILIVAMRMYSSFAVNTESFGTDSLQVEESETGEFDEEPEIVVKQDKNFNPERLDTVDGVGDIEIKKDLIAVDVDEAKSVESVIEEIEKIDGVEYAEENATFSIDITTPNDTYYGNDYDEQWSLPQIDAPEAWDSGHGTGSYVVGVVDSGIDWDHGDIIKNMWVNEGEIIPMYAANLTDFTNIDDVNSNGVIDCDDLFDTASGNYALVTDSSDDDANTYEDDYCGWDFVNDDNNPTDDHGHGTHVAGIIGAVGNNSKGISGVVWDVKVMALKFIDPSGSGSLVDAVPAIDYAKDNGAHIINMSWRGTSSSLSLQTALTDAYNAGLVPVAVSGNDWESVDNWYPAAMNDILTVGATNTLDDRASFSNYGVKVEIAAPGVHILSLRASGTPIGSCSSHDNSNYKYCGGTSMAAPIVSGVAALVWEQDPSLTNEQVMQILIEHTDSVSWDHYSGRGRINADKAVDDPTTTAGTVSEITSRVAVDEDEPTVGNTVNVTVTIYDGEGTPLNGKTVYVESSRGSTDTIAPSTDTTDALGEASFTLDSTKSGELYLTAYEINGTGGDTSDDFLVAYMPSVEYKPGPHTKFGFASISGMRTKVSKTITIYAQDQYGNTVPSFLNKATLSDKSGTLSTGQTGDFFSGVWTGSVKVDSYYLNNRLTATYTDKTGNSNYFDVTHPNITISSVSQDYSYRYYSRYAKRITIKGSGFRDGLTVKLKRTGTEIECTSIDLQSKTQLSCKVYTKNKETGYWEVFARNAGITTTAGTLSNTFGVYRRSDLNRDWGVDIFDFSQLLGDWGSSDIPISDMNEDEIVDILDFSIMLGEWVEAY